MKNLVKLLLFSLISPFLIAQTPCENGMAGEYPCNGYDLQSFISLEEMDGIRGNDSWGWTDPDNGNEYAIMGLKNGTAFIDISDPINPIYLGKLPTHTGESIWRDIKVYENHAFIVSEASNHGMQVFDLTRLRSVPSPPETFTEDAHYDGFGSSHNIAINEESGYAYSVGDNTFSGGAHFIDISDPINPTAAGGYSGDGYTHDAHIVTYNGPDTDYIGKEIYVGSNEDRVVIVDVTDKNNPQHIASVSYPNFSYTHQGWLTEDFSYYILGDEADEIDFGFNTKTIILDLTDLDNPIHSFDYNGPTLATDHNGYVKGDLFYLANNAAGLRVIDISDISNGNMTEIGYFDSHPINDFAGYQGIWSTYPYFESGNIVISDREGFLVVKSSTLAIEENSISNFKIHPNPASNTININSINFPISDIKIYDLSGKLLLSNKYNSLINTTVNISNYSNGIYILKLNNQFTTKIIKQ
ncbi:MAG: choice-of-anchor B domain-containing protein [bacterium]|jgi:choice-of-anchor B domain-containing protein